MNPAVDRSICGAGAARLTGRIGSGGMHAASTITRARAPTKSIAKIAFHPQLSMASPPRMGPSGAPSEPAALQMAVARARYGAWTSHGIKASDIGVNTLAPSPMTARPTSSPITVGLNKGTAAPTPNRQTPINRRRRCPMLSPKRPPGSSAARKPSV